VVPKGTNGGISRTGTAASALGGLFLGVVFFGVGLVTTRGYGLGDGAEALQWRLIPFAAWGGFLGSWLDSLIGATFQYSGLDAKQNKVRSGRLQFRLSYRLLELTYVI
jgi:uncharacterized membrane protein